MLKNVNRLICRNAVWIEGTHVGEFESFELQADSRTLGDKATLVLPLYAVGISRNNEQGARRRMRDVFNRSIIKPSAYVEVFCWYDGYEAIRVFAGFIEHIQEGFPTKLHLMDNAFILRFGEIKTAWNDLATLQRIVQDVIPVAQEAFMHEREKVGLPRTLPLHAGMQRVEPYLYYDTGPHNVQALTSPMSFRNFGAFSPYDVIQRLMNLLLLHGGVTKDFGVFVGADIEDANRPIIHLDTRLNVIDREIVPVDGRFIDYEVTVSGTMRDGKQKTVSTSGGFKPTEVQRNQNDFERTHSETVRRYSTLDTEEELKAFANRLLRMLKQMRNKGKITLLLYPKVDVLDVCRYTDSLFPELSAQYMIINYTFKASEKGYFQTLEVTDKVIDL